MAARAGMPLPDDRDDTGKIKRRILAMNKIPPVLYFEQLNTDEGRAARGYLRGRALSDGTIKRFGLGYSPEGYHATSDYLRKKGYTEEEMLTGGIIKRGQRGGTYDFFHGRVMFPIIDLRGNVIAFGGRRMGDEGGPKYLNSGDTPVFKKSRNMFALNIAKRSQSKRYILCEGYMDAIALHQAGFDTAVAPLGTAFTPEQAKLLSTYADELVLCYDSDEAGQKATRRAIGILANEPVKVSILTVQTDPDEFIKKYGPERFQMLLDGCNNAIEYELARAKAHYDLTKPDGRVGYLRDAIEILSGRVTPTERDVYAGRLAEETDVEKKTVLTQLEARLRAKSRKAAKEREKALLGEGAAAQIKVPYTQGGQKALGVAFARAAADGRGPQGPRAPQGHRRAPDAGAVYHPGNGRGLSAAAAKAAAGRVRRFHPALRRAAGGDGVAALPHPGPELRRGLYRAGCGAVYGAHRGERAEVRRRGGHESAGAGGISGKAQAEAQIKSLRDDPAHRGR